MKRHARTFALLLIPLLLLTTSCGGGAKAKREKEQARLETAMLDSLKEANRALVWVTDAKDPQLDQVDAVLTKCESIERELQALGPLRATAEQASRDARALRLVAAAHRAGRGPESDRLRQQASELLEAPGRPIPIPPAKQGEKP